MIAYIEYEVQADNGKLKGEDDLIRKIHSKYAMALASLAAGDLEESPTMEVITPFGVHNGAQGATFQILVVAYYLATGELEDIEVPRVVKLFKDEEDQKKNKNEIFRALRYVDVLLADKTWVELKSLKRSYTKANDIVYSKALSPWNMSKDKAYAGTGTEVADEELKPSTKYHKQFSLDWIAKKIGSYSPSTKSGGFVEVEGVSWFFHKFKVSAHKSASGKQEELSPVIDAAKGGIPERLMKYPLPTNNKAFRYSYGQRITPAQQPMVVREFEATTLLFDKLKQLGKLPEDIKNIADVEL